MSTRQAYTIEAHSPSQNQTLRWFNLMELADITDERTAQQLAQSHAQVLNSERKLNATDWIGVARLETVGVGTLNGYIGHNPDPNL